MEVVTAPIIRGWMEGAHQGIQASNWKQPPGIKTAPAFIIRSHVGIGSVEPSPATDIYPSWFQSKNGTSVSQTIDKVSGKLATSCTPDLSRETQSNSNTSSFSIDKFVPGGMATTAVTGTDDVHNCDDLDPQVTISGVTGNTIQLVASAGTHPLVGSYNQNGAGTITVTADGQTICTLTITNPSLFQGSCTYTGNSNKPVAVTATVIDSVLYSGTDSNTLEPAKDTGPGGPTKPPKPNNQ
jgi:hypothetical protein